jgi:hypothetical protein
MAKRPVKKVEDAGLVLVFLKRDAGTWPVPYTTDCQPQDLDYLLNSNQGWVIDEDKTNGSNN